MKENNSIKKKKSGLGSFIDKNSPDQKLNLHKTSLQPALNSINAHFSFFSNELLFATSSRLGHITLY